MSSSTSINSLLSAQAHTSSSDPAQIECCCRDSSCAFLAKGRSAVQSLHIDIRNAASVGQALLDRHESYVSTAEQEKSRLRDQLAILDSQNKHLQSDNARILSENRQLLDQLDSLNSSIEESDARIKSLTATLHSTQHEYHRLKLLAARTEVLEEQLFRLEQDQERLRCTLTTTAEEERAARQGWRESQRTIVELQRQVEQVEDEARQDKQRHAELLERHQRRSSIQTAIRTSRERSGKQSDQSGEVVSAFVRELLEDNTKLQLSMAELRDMLVESQDETELLRNKLTGSGIDETTGVLPDNVPSPSLGTELGEQDHLVSQELHVHHHYHGPRSVATRSRPGQSRPKRKRPSVLSGLTPSIPETQAQHLSSHGRQDSTASSVFSDDPAARTRLWSHQHALSRSSVAVSSGPSSPRSSAYCPSTIFEQGSDGNESSITRPSSPGDDSENLWSPTLIPSHARMASECADLQPLVSPLSPPEDSSSNPVYAHPGILQPDAALDTASVAAKLPSPRRGLRKSPSSSSLISVSGMDIHSTFPSSPLYNAPGVLRSRHSNADMSQGPVVSVTNASANMAEQASVADVGSSLRQSLAKVADHSQGSHGRDSFSSWLVSRWKGRQDSSSSQGGKNERDSPRDDSAAKVKTAVAVRRPRAAGVNQMGALPIEEYLRRHARPVLTSRINSEALKESLEESVERASADPDATEA